MENLILPTVISTAMSSIPSNYFSQHMVAFVNPEQNTSISRANKWQSFLATAQPTNVFLQWSMTDNQHTVQFLIQHSQDGLSWNTIERRNVSATAMYSFIHSEAQTGANYYRLVVSDTDDEINYSPVQLVDFTGETKDVQLDSNVITNGVLKVQIKKATSILLYTTDGTVFHRAKYAPGYQGIDMSGMAKGIYWLSTGTFVEKITIK